MKPKYVLITGAGDGLGRSFAFCCAARGYNLVLVSLPGSKLDRLSHHISDHYKVVVYWLELDLCSENCVDRIMDFLDENDLRLNMLINNAGIGYNKLFETITEEQLIRQIRLNITIPVLLTHRLLPMLKQHGPSHIINVSSMASFFPSPTKCSYSSSKSYLKQFSLSLRTELEGENVQVSVVCPSGITTNAYHYVLCQSRGPLSRISTMHPDAVAEYTLKRSLKGAALIIPGRFNRILLLITRLIPNRLKISLTKNSLKIPDTFIPLHAISP